MRWEKATEDGEYLIYKNKETESKHYTLMFDKNRLVCDFTQEEFIYKENMWTPQQQETNPAIKWSCKYGHWQKSHPEIDIKTAEFIVKILDILTEHQEERS